VTLISHKTINHNSKEKVVYVGNQPWVELAGAICG